MSFPISVRLDESIRQTLIEEARARGIGLSAYLHEIAAEEARRVKRERIRQQSRQVGAYIAAKPEARRLIGVTGSRRSRTSVVPRRWSRTTSSSTEPTRTLFLFR